MSGLRLLIVGVAEKGDVLGFCICEVPRGGPRFKDVRRVQREYCCDRREKEEGWSLCKKWRPWYKWTDSLHTVTVNWYVEGSGPFKVCLNSLLQPVTAQVGSNRILSPLDTGFGCKLWGGGGLERTGSRERKENECVCATSTASEGAGASGQGGQELRGMP